MNKNQLIPTESISQKIFIIRGHKVMLDADLAGLYQVLTKNLNLAVRRNIKRFPDDFMFQLTEKEYQDLRLQIVTSSLGDGEALKRFQIGTGLRDRVSNRSQIATGSKETRFKSKDLISQIAISSWGGRRNLPHVFTEHGVAMLSSVLRSPRAVQMNIFIIRAFIKLRELLASNKELGHKVEEIEREQKLQNKHINAVYSILDKFIKEPLKPKGTIGFGKA